MTRKQLETAGQTISNLLTLDGPGLDDLELTGTPISTETGWRNFHVQLHAVRAGTGNDVTIRAEIDEDGEVTWGRRDYPAETWQDIADPTTAASCGDEVIGFTCPEHGDRAAYSADDNEAWCVDRDEVLDLEHPDVQAAIAAARKAPAAETV